MNTQRTRTAPSDDPSPGPSPLRRRGESSPSGAAQFNAFMTRIPYACVGPGRLEARRPVSRAHPYPSPAPRLPVRSIG